MLTFRWYLHLKFKNKNQMLYYLPLTHFILTFEKLEQREQVTFSRKQKRLDGVKRSSPSRLGRRSTATELWTRSKHEAPGLVLSTFPTRDNSKWVDVNVLQVSDAPTVMSTFWFWWKTIHILCTLDCSRCCMLLDVVAEMCKCKEHCILGTLLCLSVRYNQHNMPLCLCSHHCPSKMALVSALSSLSGGVRNCQVLAEIHRGAGPSQGRRRAMHTQRKVSWSIGCAHRCSVSSPAAAVSHVG